jgi:hypothetical protein
MFLVGSYVIHKQLAELGAGEIVSREEGRIRIRFASGERLFSEALVAPHLEVTREAPVAPAPAATGRKKATKPRKA